MIQIKTQELRDAVQDDLITIRSPTTRAEMLWLLKLAHLVISDVDKTLEETFAPAQPAVEREQEHGKCTDESTGQFTGSFYHETYEFDGKSKTYYFDSGKLFAYEDVV